MVRRALSSANKRFVEFVTAHASLFRFIFTGAVNTGIDLVLYGIFANILNIQPIIASIFSTGITLCFSYFMNHYFVFRSDKRKRQTAVLFVVITLVNVWLIQSAVIWTVLRVFAPVAFFQDHLWTFNMFAKLCGVSVSTVLNYLGYRKIFRGLDDKKQED